MKNNLTIILSVFIPSFGVAFRYVVFKSKALPCGM
jgi:hypothetical protein